VALERQGQPVADVSGMTVTVRNGTVTFDGGPATSRMQPMRIEYGALGTIRVSDAAGSGSGLPNALPLSLLRGPCAAPRPAGRNPGAVLSSGTAAPFANPSADCGPS